MLLQDVVIAVDGNDLHLTDAADASDGIIDYGVTIEDFFLGGNTMIETLRDGAGQQFDLTSLIA